MAENDDMEANETASKMRKLRPPNRKKFNDDIELLKEEIKEKEKRIKSIVKPLPQTSSESTAKKDKLINELAEIRNEKQNIVDRRRSTDEELKALNKQVAEKNNNITRLLAGLHHYKSQESIDDAIKKLEFQLQVQRLSLKEEKHLVATIDAMKRSKKTLKTYNLSQQALNEDRDKVKQIRQAKDACSKEISELKAKEDKIKETISSLKIQNDDARIKAREKYAEKDSLRKEIDDLYNKKRELTANFYKELNMYNKQSREMMKRSKDERSKRKEERELARQLAIKEYENSLLPFENEITTCSSLITYLQRTGSSVDVRSQDDVNDAAGPKEDKISNSEYPDGVFISKKSDDDEEFMTVTKKSNKKRARKNRKVVNTKRLNHHTEVFEQFLSLSLHAPATTAEIPQLMETLQGKLKHYKSEQDAEIAKREIAKTEENNENGYTDHDDTPISDTIETDTLSAEADLDNEANKSENELNTED
ncbi:Uncharacterized protein C458.02c [Trichoplax sp. H2]|nr:Uncharacterized protein C458.02c [Trichoplax sp. H2]|eukprot:RDD44720.1 Uncharacterized protein C458.02c [Trichoplax sp. H2]